MGLQFSANLSMLFTEHPFQKRFAAAAASGFEAVEFWFPFDHGGKELLDIAADAGVQVVLFNLNPGDLDAEEWGTVGIPGREEYFRHSLDAALQMAEAFGCRRLNALAGRVPEGISREACLETARQNLRWAVESLPPGIKLVVEALNEYDMPRYLLPNPEEAATLVREINHPALLLLYDVYHAKRVGIDILGFISENQELIGHVQIADVPGRHQPGTGRIPFPTFFEALEGVNYEGYIGLEYKPEGPTDESFAWLNAA